MRVAASCLLVLSIVLVFLSGCKSTDNTAIQWKDPVVEMAIRDYLNKPDGPIYPYELDDITRITVSGYKFYINEQQYVALRVLPDGSTAYYPGGGSRTTVGASASGITTLSDFSNCNNLEGLRLYSTAFSELSGIEELARLDKLSGFSIAGNANLSDISGLSSLSNLMSLELCSIELDSFDELAKMENLNMLTLIDTNIESLDPVCSLKSLKILYLEDNQVSDLSPLANLKMLKTLYFKNNAPSIDLSPLKELESLETFHYESGDGIVIDSLDAISNLINT